MNIGSFFWLFSEKLAKMALLMGKDVADDVNEKIYVAVSKEWKAWKTNLEWVVRNSKGKTLCFVHVHHPAQYIYLCECLYSFVF